MLPSNVGMLSLGNLIILPSGVDDSALVTSFWGMLPQKILVILGALRCILEPPKALSGNQCMQELPNKLYNCFCKLFHSQYCTLGTIYLGDPVPINGVNPYDAHLAVVVFCSKLNPQQG